MNANSYQTIDYNLLESFISHAKAIPKQDQTNLDKILALDGPFLTALLRGHNDVSSIISVLDRLKALIGSLDVLSRIVKEGLSGVRSAVLPAIYQKGFLSLPAEVIAQIFEEVCDGDEPRVRACEDLALVSKNFRDIALKTPRLWTRLTNFIYPEHYLERSKTIGIDIALKIRNAFGGSNNPDRGRLFLQMVAPRSSRWRSFSIDDFDISWQGLFSDLGKIPSLNTLLALEALRIDYQHDGIPVYGDYVMDNEQDPDKDLRHFFITWEMPALRAVETVNLIPPLPTATIPCLKLKLEDEHDYSHFWKIREIITLLQPLHSLSELSVELISLNQISRENIVPIELPQLKKLRLSTEEVEGNFLRDLLGAISMPNVMELTLHLSVYVLGGVDRQLKALFPKKRLHWPRLKSLDFSLEISELDHDPEEEGTLDTALTRLPQIEHLRITCIGMEHPSTIKVHKRERGRSPYPPLRTLNLRDCRMFDTSFIFSIKDILITPEFESLHIYDCPKIDEAVARKMMPKDKELKWELSPLLGGK